MKRLSLILAAAFAFTAVTAYAHSYKLGAIQIGHTWTTPTPAGATEAGIYLPLLNTGADADTLISASSSMATSVEIRQTPADGKGAAQKLDGLKLTPNAPIALRQGGTYLLAVGLKKPLAEKDRLPLTLKFEKAGSVDIEAMVGAPH